MIQGVNYKQKVAYHEAGHAVAIHFNNRLKNLPPVFFKITLDDLYRSTVNTGVSAQGDGQGGGTRIKGGRLIQLLSFADNGTDP